MVTPYFTHWLKLLSKIYSSSDNTSTNSSTNIGLITQHITDTMCHMNHKLHQKTNSEFLSNIWKGKLQKHRYDQMYKEKEIVQPNGSAVFICWGCVLHWKTEKNNQYIWRDIFNNRLKKNSFINLRRSLINFIKNKKLR